MGLSEFLRYVAGEAAAIAQAPLIFFAAVVAVCGVAYAIARWAYSTIIAHKDAVIASLEARVKLRDDQLANKLESTPPDEARAMIAALQDQVAKLQPRRLTEPQRQAFIDGARAPSGSEWRIKIRWYGLVADAEMYARDFILLFADILGWKVVAATRQLGGGNDYGIVLAVGDLSNLTDAERALRSAFERAALRITTVQNDDAKEPGLVIGYREDR
jgi:hypothetical protein